MNERERNSQRKRKEGRDKNITSHILIMIMIISVTIAIITLKNCTVDHKNNNDYNNISVMLKPVMSANKIAILKTKP